MKFDSSQDLAHSATRSMQNIELECANLRAILHDLQLLRHDHIDNPQADGLVESAFKFDSYRSDTSRRPSLPDPVFLENVARNRRKRSEFFGAGIFADPAWDMIIDLAIAKARFARVSVTSLCIASGVPSTTALRWIGLLIDRGFFQREDDATDKRRTFISLTDVGMRKVATYFSEVEVGGSPII